MDEDDVEVEASPGVGPEASDTGTSARSEGGLGANYWRLWTASVVSNLGDGVATVAYPWLASSLTRSPIHLAGVAMASRIPWLLFSLPAGAVTDRVDRRRLIVAMDSFRFVVTLVVAITVGLRLGGLP